MSVYKIETKEGVVGIFYKVGDATEKHISYARKNNIFAVSFKDAPIRIARLLANGEAFSFFEFEDELHTNCFGGFGGTGDPSSFYNKTPVDNLRIFSELSIIQFDELKKLKHAVKKLTSTNE